VDSKQPLVSIAIASYQHRKFLRECLDSVLSQTYKNIEVVIVDDGSTDGSQEIIKDYASKHPNVITALFPFNKGVPYTQLKMLELCSGKYICIFDGDDVMFPEKIEKQVNFLEKHPEYQMCFHDVMVFDDDDQKNLYTWSEKYDWTTCAKDALFQANWSFKKTRTKRTPSGSKFGRASYIKNGVTDVRISARIEFLFVLGMEASMPGASWYTIPEVLGIYRLHDHNISRANSGNWLKNAEEASVAFSLARVKFPSYINYIVNEEAFWWFNEILHNPNLPQQNKKYYTRDFRSRFGLLKYFYLIGYSAYLKIRRRGNN